LLGRPEHGRFLLAPRAEPRRVERRYREGTLVLETEYETADGVVTVVDAMPPRDRVPDLVRIVQGRHGRVRMSNELRVRFGYGQFAPWIKRLAGDVVAVSGGDALRLSTPVETRNEGVMQTAEFRVSEGEQVPFVLTWFASHEAEPSHLDPSYLVSHTESWWRAWSERCTYEGEWRDAVVRSLITLKALTYGPTGGVVAAPTTSLPEQLGGVRNWDYRYCWLRDAAFTLAALRQGGYEQEALAWQQWLRAHRPQPTTIWRGRLSWYAAWLLRRVY
jgi:GH15 family glucan-1,4-alpha-glucosidase